MQKIVPYRGDIEGCAIYCTIVSTDVQPHCANSQSLPELHNVNMLTDSELCCMMIAVAASRKKGKKKGSQKGRKWAKQWFIDREKFTHEKLLNELIVIEPNDFRNFVRMNGELVDELLALVAPEIEKRNTIMRDAIAVSQRLSITLRYLATGNSFEDLKFLTAVSPQSIGHIVMETCTSFRQNTTA